MSNTKPIIILLGPPGSGKGTQAKRLAQAFNLPHISTGDLFRQNIAFETSLGLQVKDLIQAGHLVPDSVVEAMLFERINEKDCENGYILDGFPRTLAQADSFHNHIKNLDFSIHVLEFAVPDQVIIKRASDRLTCKQCGSIFNRGNNSIDGKCDKCGGELFQRLDDRAEVVKERLQIYARQTEPLIKYYSDRRLLTKFNGNQGADNVFSDIVGYFSGLSVVKK